MPIKITASTMGSAAPGGEALLSRSGYRYKGRAGWPYDPATRDSGSLPRHIPDTAPSPTGKKAQRMQDYAEARRVGFTAEESAEYVGVKPGDKAARAYELAYLASGAATP